MLAKLIVLFSLLTLSGAYISYGSDTECRAPGNCQAPRKCWPCGSRCLCGTEEEHKEVERLATIAIAVTITVIIVIILAVVGCVAGCICYFNRQQTSHPVIHPPVLLATVPAYGIPQPGPPPPWNQPPPGQPPPDAPPPDFDAPK